MDDIERRQEIGLQHPARDAAALYGFFCRSPVQDTGICDEQVDGCLSPDVHHEGRERISVRHIEAGGPAVRAFCPTGDRHRFEALDTAAQHGERAALCGEGAGEGRADAAGCAGDDDRLETHVAVSDRQWC